MTNLCSQIINRIERYEKRMLSAMEKNDETLMRQVCEEFDTVIGREVKKLAMSVPEDLQRELLSLFESPSWTIGESGDGGKNICAIRMHNP